MADRIIVLEINYEVIHKETSRVLFRANSVEEAKDILFVKKLNPKEYDIVRIDIDSIMKKSEE